MSKKATPDAAPLSEAQVAAWLRAHPDFLQARAAELLNDANDGNVVDLQRVLVTRLQTQVRELREENDALVVAGRGNHSVQAQVHQAALALVAARNLEQLVEVLTTDLMQHFGVDVVRLGLESPIAEAYDVQYREQNYSGICFLTLGLVEDLLGSHKRVRLVSDVTKNRPEGFEEIFAECSGLVNSCALLRLQLPRTKRYGVLAFGAREVGRFHPKQGSELLVFLSRLLEVKLDEGLRNGGLEELLD